VTADLPPQPPAADKRPVIDTYHGVAVSDPYRWLENAADPAVQKWSDDQNAFTRQALDALPDRTAIRARVTQLLSSPSADYSALRAQAGRLFALEKHPPKQQSFLVVMKSLDDAAAERVVVVARLQAATSSAQPILLRTSKTTGHGHSNPLSEEIDENVDVYSFLFHELDVRFHSK
jgi:protease II